MKCPHCGLSNLDHVSRCVKCGRGLSASAPAPNTENIPTLPPRAKPASKFFRNIFYSIRRENAGFPADKAERIPRNGGAGEEADGQAGIAFSELLRELKPGFMGIVPGLGHWHAKRKITASIIAATYLLSLLLGIFFYGRMASNFLFGLMMTAHAVSIFDCFRFDVEINFRTRLAFMGAVYIFVMIGYLQVYRTVTFRVYGFWVGREHAASSLIQRGDFIIARRKGPPYSRGEIVRFRRGYQAIREYRQGQPGLGVAAGEYFDRIIGCSGDKISIRGKIFYVNGFPLPEDMYPLNGNHIFPDMEVTLGNNEYLIIPSAFRGGNNIPVDFFANYCRVSEDFIDSSLLMIYAPLERMRLLNQ